MRLPKAFRFAGSEAFIRKDAATGGVVLSAWPPADSWVDFFALRARTHIAEDFLSDRPLDETKPLRDPFANERAAKPRRRKEREVCRLHSACYWIMF
ncbi:MAG: antitoxin [Burkholderiales bacterium]